MDGKLFIDKDECQTAVIKIPEYYEIDVEKISSVNDLALLIKAMYANCYLQIYENNPYYEDLKHLAKAEAE